jgi:hypothetical protein
MSFGIKISKPGKDTNKGKPEDMMVDTSIDMFKFYKQGYAKIPIDAYDGVTAVQKNFSIRHELGYMPMYFLFFKGKTGKWGQLGIQAQSLNYSKNFPYAGTQSVSPSSIDFNIIFNNYPDLTAYPAHEVLLSYIVMYEELEDLSE